MSRPQCYALCTHVFRMCSDTQYTKFHPADTGSRFYLCDCGSELALRDRLNKLLDYPSTNKVHWDIYHKASPRKGQHYLQTKRMPYL